MAESVSTWLGGQAGQGSERQRRRLVDFALNMTSGTHLAASPYERELLGEFVKGTLSIEQVLEQLEASPQKR